MAFFLHQGSLAMPYFEDDDDPKKPRPVNASKKTEGWNERTESRKEDIRDPHAHAPSPVGKA